MTARFPARRLPLRVSAGAYPPTTRPYGAYLLVPTPEAITGLGLTELVQIAGRLPLRAPTPAETWSTWHGPAFDLYDVDGGLAALVFGPGEIARMPAAAPTDALHTWLGQALRRRDVPTTWTDQEALT